MSSGQPFDASRRNFLRDSALWGGAGLSLGLPLSGCSGEPSETKSIDQSPAGKFSPSVWLTVNADNSVILTVAETEMGQGVLTALPMLIAEELDLNWQQVQVRQAPVEPEFGNQLTGGSTSVRRAWQPLREAGATARQALVEAAANSWQAPLKQCVTAAGSVIWSQGGRTASYGELALLAAQRPLPTAVVLKSPKDYRILGRPQQRVDLEAKTSGAALFGIDTQVDGLRVAVIARSPRLGATVAAVESKRALTVSGVIDVINLGSGVAVIATGYWQAQQGKAALDIQWRDADETVDSGRLEQQMLDRLEGSAELAWRRGNGAVLNGDDEEIIEATYQLPLQAHATMEPMNCTAWIRDGLCEVWAPTQAPTQARDRVAGLVVSTLDRYWQKLELRVTGKRTDPVLIHTTLVGGGFGRRSEADFVEDAVSIALQVDYPVKLIYSREDDFSSDYFRPPSVQRLRVRLNAQGMPTQWHHRLVSNTGSASGAKRLPYAIPDALVDVQVVDIPNLRHGYWRSVAHSYTAFAVESFIDELAVESGVDPLEYRLKMLPDAPRNRGVLEMVAQMADWHVPAPDRYQGIAGHYAFGSYIAQVVELARAPTGKLRLTKIYCAFDCGQVVDPDIVEAQLQGSIIYAITAALKSQVSVKDGVVEQQDFVGFPLLSFAETPEINIRLIDSSASPGGVGEPGVPPLLPALANALFAATGERYRSFPVVGLSLLSGQIESS